MASQQLTVPVPPLFHSIRKNGEPFADKKSAVEYLTTSDSNQSTPSNDEPRLRRASRDDSSPRQSTAAVLGQSENNSGGLAKNDVSENNHGHSRIFNRRRRWCWVSLKMMMWLETAGRL